jgi:hypothetical protein
MLLPKLIPVLRIVVAAALLGLLASCGSGSGPMNSGNFSGTVANQNERVADTVTSGTGVARVTLSPAHLTGGASTAITVALTQPAPGDGIAVQLKSSDSSTVAIPAIVRIPSGQTSATVLASTAPVTAARTVAISALYGDTVAGTSLNIAPTVSGAVALGTDSLRAPANDGTASQNASLTSPDPQAQFRGCWYRQNGHRYQGVYIKVANPGTYPFDADLFRGATCDPAKKADEFGFGTRLHFGGFGYIFWFTDFADQIHMSAFWHVGKDKSKCVSYAIAPDC